MMMIIAADLMFVLFPLISQRRRPTFWNSRFLTLSTFLMSTKKKNNFSFMKTSITTHSMRVVKRKIDLDRFGSLANITTATTKR
jgi:hypothetical protein